MMHGILVIGDQKIPVIVTGISREIREKPVCSWEPQVWKEYEPGPATYTVEQIGEAEGTLTEAEELERREYTDHWKEVT